MRALDRKLLRDLWRLRGQVMAIGLVVASGVGVMVMALSAHDSLELTARAYYERYYFAEVFANVERAPQRLVERIGGIAGVQTVETRVVRFATLDVAGFEEPVMGQLVSVPEGRQPDLNRLVLRAGRLVAPGRPDEVVLNEPFAEAHGLGPGDHLYGLINGHRRRLEVVGVALSPEFVYAIGPGALMPDDRRYGILWMGRDALAAAFDLDGAFNSVALTLARGTDPQAVVERLDRLLERYGGVGAVAREHQVSNWFLMNEIKQLKAMAAILPTIFLLVAGFLTHMVLARLIATERSEIGLMKAFGYSNFDVAWHYAKLAMGMISVGIVAGWLLGAWMGRYNTEMYADFFRFPLLIFQPRPAVFMIGAGISLAAALAGALGAASRAAALPPATAMLPPAPAVYRRSWLSRSRFGRWLDEPTRIILRQIGRRPLRALLTSAGVALSVAVMIMALQWLDAIDHMIDTYFVEAQRQDLTVGLIEARPLRVVHDFRTLPGVMAAEPARMVGVELRAGSRSHRGSLEGVLPQARLQLVRDVDGRVLRVPTDGLVLGTKLADKLGVGLGDLVDVEVLEGRRPRLSLPLVDRVETYIGMPAYIDLRALNRAMRESPRTGIVYLRVDPLQMAALFAELKQVPAVSAVLIPRIAVDTFRETLGETTLIFVTFFAAFAAALGIGVVYNSTRITLSERGRELATLRVLGFSGAEVAYILIGEVAVLIGIGLPLGCLAGAALAWVMTAAFDTELYRIPMVIEASTFGLAMVLALAAAIASAAVVGRRLKHLDLIAVLKTRE